MKPKSFSLFSTVIFLTFSACSQNTLSKSNCSSPTYPPGEKLVLQFPDGLNKSFIGNPVVADVEALGSDNVPIRRLVGKLFARKSSSGRLEFIIQWSKLVMTVGEKETQPVDRNEWLLKLPNKPISPGEKIGYRTPGTVTVKICP